MQVLKAALRQGVGRGRAWRMAGAGTLVVSGLMAGACTGQIDAGSPRLEGAARDQQPGLGEAPGPDAAVVVTAECELADRAPLRLLTRLEYHRTLRDLLGVEGEPLALSPSADGSGFDNEASRLGVHPALVEQYMTVAEEVVGELDLPVLLDGLGVCDGRSQEGAVCAGQLVERFGLRAFRHPVPDALRDSLVQDVFSAGETQGGFDEGARWVLIAMLQSPHFLYRLEFGIPRGDGISDLTGYEVASRLSYFLAGTAPDAQLLDAAQRGRLMEPGQIGTHARRLLATPAARESVARMHEQWLQLGKLATAPKDAARYPSYDAVRGDMAREALAYLEHLVFSQGAIGDIFDNDHVMVNRELAEYYSGKPHPELGEELQWHPAAELGIEDRRGVLLMGSFLSIMAHASHTSPVHRGLFIRQQMLCQQLPSPPNDVPGLEPPAAGVGVRQRLDQHRKNPACASCHAVMDPVGFPFEHFDAAGLWRDDDLAGPVDASGEIRGIDGEDVEVDGAHEVAALLAQSDEAARCVTRQWLRYALGRALGAAEQCVVDEIYERVAGKEAELLELLVAITESPMFSTRVTPSPEGACQ